MTGSKDSALSIIPLNSMIPYAAKRRSKEKPFLKTPGMERIEYLSRFWTSIIQIAINKVKYSGIPNIILMDNAAMIGDKS